jgi:cytochrome c biogenesis protein CcmG/thiol:disulfide interchange protein DsbE
MNWRRAAIGSLAAAPVIALLAWGMTRDPKEIISPLPGRIAPPFTLGVFAAGEPPLARPVGDTLALGRLRGKVVVLNFWASWCLECRVEHKDLSAVARRMADKPVQFVGVLYNDVPKAGLEWITEMGGQAYPGTTDPGARTAIDYGLYGVPETFVIDPAGKVAYKHTGPFPAELLAFKIDSLLAVSAPGKAGAQGPVVP